MSAVVGIDLGTTNTVVAHVQGGRAVALADENGERLIPSVVSFHPSGQVIVGRAAKERRLQDARNTIYSVKRLIGRPWASEDVQRARERAPFDLREGPGHAVMVVARGETYTLSEISAYVLRKAKAVAEAALGQPVDKAVITVPANFNDLQRAATKVAGRVAGLEVMRILNEPTAAALAYGYGKSNSERIAIYDFGGGTFDVTLLDLAGNVFEVLATAGDTFLGGDDIDLLIADRMCESFLRQHRYDPRSDVQIFERVRAAAEIIKHQLSRDTQAHASLPELAFGPGGRSLDLEFTLTRADFEKLIAPLLERTFNVCRDAMATARMNPREFDQVILVGGSTRIPIIKTLVSEFFHREPLAHVSPDEVVAIGAAIQAMALTSHDRGDPRRSSPNLGKVPTLGGLGQAAQAAASAGRPITARGVGENVPPPPPLNVRSNTILHAAPPPGLPTSLPSALTERAPTTADYSPPQAAPAPAPAPEPPPRRPPAVPSGPTKVSLGQAAREAAQKAQATPALTEDSVMSALPLVGLGTTQSRSPAPQPAPAPAPVSRSPVAASVASPEPVPPPRAPFSSFQEPLELDEQTLTIELQDPPERSTAPGPPPDPALQTPTARPVAATPAAQARVPIAPPSALPPPDPPPARPVGKGATMVLGTSPVASIPAAQPAPRIQEKPAPRAPLLVDVTPLSLSVETVGGYCDVIITRNTPIPCDGTRIFATATNNQRAVRVRVAQGESKRFQENTVLGELELDGLREAARGEVLIAVTFEIDTDGLLQVRARDTTTGHEAQARMRLIGAQDANAADAARSRQERQMVV